MLNIDEAKDIVAKTMHEGTIFLGIDYRDVYLFQVNTDDEESIFDPFVSVNKETGELKDYCPWIDGNPVEIEDAFQAAFDATQGGV